MDDSGETQDATSTGGTHPIGSAQTLPARPRATVERTRIGRYRIAKRLGAGGMGEVWQATDPELGREVAIKVLHGGELKPQLAERLRREAQALAKLDHPNVVTVHDVGVDESGELYIVMQLVAGTTLDRAIVGHTARDVIDLLAQAGRGLAAAHAAGIVHRDFKPANVLVDAHGHVRVSDFGLARASDASDDAGESLGGSLALSMTRGELVGTPAYMAPEQLRGGPVTHATDQFAFCVTLWEALCGKRPFAGKDMASLRDAVMAGPPKEPPPSIPRRLRGLLARGLSLRPADRYSSMDALLAELEPRMTGLWVAGGVGVAGLATTAVLLGVMRPEAADPCRGVDQPIDAVWGEPQRAAVRAALGTVAPGVIAALDARTTRWRTERIEACRATHSEAAPQTLDERDQRYACLDSALIDERAAVALLMRKGDGVVVAHAMQLVASGREPSWCTREYAADRVKSGQVKRLDPALTIEIAAATALRDSGHHAEALARRKTLEPRVLATGDHEAITNWLYGVSVSLDGVGERQAAREPMRRAAEAALAAHRDDLAARCYGSLAELTAQASDLEGAENLLVMARAAAVRSGKPWAASTVALSDGQVDIERGEYKSAIAKCQRARELARQQQLGAIYEADVIGCVFDAQTAAGDFDAALATARERLELQSTTYGPGSPLVIDAERALATTLFSLGKPDEAKSHWTTALDGIARIYGPESDQVAWALRDLAVAQTPDGAVTTPEAVAAIEKAAAIAAKTLAPDDPQRAQIFETQAYVYGGQRRWDDSLAAYDKALAVYEKVDDPMALARVLYNYADTLKEQKKCERALPMFARAAKVAASTGQAAVIEGGALYGRGYCLGLTKQWVEAEAVLRLAIGKFDEQEAHLFAAQTRLELAKVLVVRGKRAEAVAIAKAGAAQLEDKPPPADEMRKEIVEWLGKN